MDEKLLKNKIGDKDIEIVHSLSLGKNVRQIGRELDLKEDAVSMRIFRLRSKLKLKNSTELVSYFFRNNIIN